MALFWRLVTVIAAIAVVAAIAAAVVAVIAALATAEIIATARACTPCSAACARSTVLAALGITLRAEVTRLVALKIASATALSPITTPFTTPTGISPTFWTSIALWPAIRGACIVGPATVAFAPGKVTIAARWAWRTTFPTLRATRRARAIGISGITRIPWFATRSITSVIAAGVTSEVTAGISP